MSQLSGAELFGRLSDEEKARYISANREMVGYALNHAVPLIIAPPVSAGGEVKGQRAAFWVCRRGHICLPPHTSSRDTSAVFARVNGSIGNSANCLLSTRCRELRGETKNGTLFCFGSRMMTFSR